LNYQITQHHIPEGSVLLRLHPENLKPPMREATRAENRKRKKETKKKKYIYIYIYIYLKQVTMVMATTGPFPLG
jgi:hypothetical protein